MKKYIICLMSGMLFFYTCTSRASDAIPTFSSYITSYFTGLLAYSCEQGMVGTSVDGIVNFVAKDMATDSDDYSFIKNTATMGVAIGHKLKSGPLISNDVNHRTLNSCSAIANYMTIVWNVEKGISESLNKPGGAKKREIQSLEHMTKVMDKLFKVDNSGESLNNSTIYKTTAENLADLYDENEVAADDKIAGRKVEVKGVVQSIDKDFTGSVVVLLQSGNEFMPARLSMEDTEKSKAASLRKGQTVNIICDKMMFLIGSPSGRSCRFN